MRRILAVCLLVALFAGVARAAMVRGTPRADVLAGTPAADSIHALAGADKISTGWDDRKDTVDCGAGRDVLNADARDVPTNCETVATRLSRDTTSTFDGQHETQVEPDSLAVGKTIVTAYQSGRFFNGGAAEIGWSTSVDAGKTWRSGAVPQSRYQLVSDPVVAFDAAHGVWLIAGLGADFANIELWVSRSRDGVTWSEPIVAAAHPVEDYDKEWLTCDNSARSPFRGRCYLAYVEVGAQALGIRQTRDGGLTWTSGVTVPVRSAPGTAFTGPMPAVRPDGMVVIPYAVFLETEDQIAAVVSQDGGVTFSPPRRVSGLEFESAGELRAPPMPTVDVDKAGKLYMVWADARTREDGVSRDIALATSANGVSWAESVRLPLPLQQAAVDVDYFTPAVAVAPGTAGATAKVAVAFYSRRLANGCETFLPGCIQQIDAWLMRSDDGGRSWNAARLLSAEPMQMDWLAETSLGRMLGDYISVSWSGGKAFAVLPLATGGVFGFSEATFAATAS